MTQNVKRWGPFFVRFIRRPARWLSLSPAGLLLGTTVFLSLVLILEAFVLAHYYEVDVISSLTYVGRDTFCTPSPPDSGGLGVHCFGCYYQVVTEFVPAENPWASGRSNYAASGMLIQAAASAVGTWLGAPQIGLVFYLITLAVAISVPAIWSGRGKSIALRLILVGVFSLASLPALMTIDRGNVVGFAVPRCSASS